MQDPTKKLSLGSDPTPDTGGKNSVGGALDSFLDDLKPADAVTPDDDAAKPADDGAQDDDPVIPFDINDLGEDGSAKEGGAAPDKGDEDYTPPVVEKDPKAAHAWAELKRTNKQLKQELEAAKKDDVGEATAEKIVELQKQIESYEDRLGQYDLASTKTFQDKYVAPMRSLAGRAVGLLTRAGVEKEQAPRVAQQVLQAGSQAEIDEILVEQPVSVQAAMLTIASEYQEKDAARAAAIKDWRDSGAAIKAQEARDKEVMLARMAEQDTAKAMQAALAEGNWMFRRTAGQNQEWDANVDKLEAQVRGLVKSAEPAELIKWVIEGVTAKPLRELFAKESQRSKKLQAELSAAIKGAPKAGGGDAGDRGDKGLLSKKGPKNPDAVLDELF